MKTFGKIVFVLLSIIICPLFVGFVICQLWQWFIVPVFAVPALGLFQALGINLLITYFAIKGKIQPAFKEKTGDQHWNDFLKGVTYTVVVGWTGLLAGWIITLFL